MSGLAAYGLSLFTLLGADEDPVEVQNRVETLCFSFIEELMKVTEAPSSTSLIPHNLPVTTSLRSHFPLRRVTWRTAQSTMQVYGVLACVHEFLRLGRRVSQRELYYILIHLFDSQVALNRTVLRVSAILDVPRFALNIDGAPRGIMAGRVKVALTSSDFFIDCRHVGCVSLHVAFGHAPLQNPDETAK